MCWASHSDEGILGWAVQESNLRPCPYQRHALTD
jgi:hypothetical protein